MRLFTLAYALILVLTSTSCNAQAQSAAISHVDVSNFVTQYQAATDAQLLDVRSPAECEQGSLATATQCHISDAAFKEKVSKLDKSKPVFVYCAAGGRSSKASTILAELGFLKIINLKGAGYAELKEAGLK